jgi:hypothetical protein
MDSANNCKWQLPDKSIQDIQQKKGKDKKNTDFQIFQMYIVM